ncbi:hypothetical protein EG329_005285 [Mollisiaceae sp. DMI_Dod_QoI]|nr:hypothetical protein EG329_005285 [Helotiales sp. DMI_Dod_QoI]
MTSDLRLLEGRYINLRCLIARGVGNEYKWDSRWPPAQEKDDIRNGDSVTPTLGYQVIEQGLELRSTLDAAVLFTMFPSWYQYHGQTSALLQSSRSMDDGFWETITLLRGKWPTLTRVRINGLGDEPRRLQIRVCLQTQLDMRAHTDDSLRIGLGNLRIQIQKAVGKLFYCYDSKNRILR